MSADIHHFLNKTKLDSVTKRNLVPLFEGVRARQNASSFDSLEEALRAGVPLWLDPGTYTLPAALALPDGADLEAAPGTVTITKPNGGTDNLLTATGTQGIRLRGIRFDGKRRNGGGVTGISLLLTDASDVVIEGCTFYDGMNLIIDDGCEDVLVTGNRFDLGKYGIGIGLLPSSAMNTGIRILGNWVGNMESEGVDVNYNARGVVIAENYLFGNHTTSEGGREAIDVGGGTCEDIVIANNVIDCDGVSPVGINVKDGATRVLVKGNTVVNGLKADSSGRGIWALNCTGVVVEGNHVKDFYRGIQVGSCPNTLVRGNQVIGSVAFGISIDGASASGTVVEGNVVDGVDVAVATGSGVDVVNASYVTVAKNRVLNCAGNGIAMRSTGGYHRVLGNDASFCNGDGISISTTHTLVEGNVAHDNGDSGITVNAAWGTYLGNHCVNNSRISAAQYGFIVNSGMNNLVIKGNTCTDNNGTKKQGGLRFAGACDRVILVGNLLYENTTNTAGTASLTNSVNADNITA